VVSFWWLWYGYRWAIGLRGAGENGKWLMINGK